MKKPRPINDSWVVVGKKKDKTGRTPFTEYRRTGKKTEVFYGHLSDSKEDRKAIERVNASVDEAFFAERPSNL